MFLVYNEETGKFTTGRSYPTLVLVNLTAIDKLSVRLEAAGMPSLVFPLPQNSGKKTDCSMWWDEPMKCIDCGNAPAEWISMFVKSFSLIFAPDVP